MKLSPRSEAIAFRIWQFANPRGWDVTLREIADELGQPMGAVRRIASIRGWNNRMRVTSPHPIDTNLTVHDTDPFADHMIGNTSLTA